MTQKCREAHRHHWGTTPGSGGPLPGTQDDASIAGAMNLSLDAAGANRRDESSHGTGCFGHRHAGGGR
jgi:hypothetical protein